MEIQTVKLTAIEVPPRMADIRPELFGASLAPVKELAADIERRGLLEPILLRGDAEKAELVAGLRRYRAFQALSKAGKKAFNAIPAIFVKGSEARIISDTHAENFHRANPTFAATAALASELKASGKNGAEIAEELGIPSSTVRHALNLWAKAAPEVRAALSKGLITRDDATRIADLPPDKQPDALKKVIEAAKEPVGRKEKAKKKRAAVGADVEDDDDDSRPTAQWLCARVEELRRVQAGDSSEEALIEAVCAAFLVAAGRKRMVDLYDEVLPFVSGKEPEEKRAKPKPALKKAA